jgi:hypothetical protein
VVALLALVLVGATPALAVVAGGCTVKATGTKSGAFDLTTQAEWHVRSDDIVSGSGAAPTDQTFVTISAYVLGAPVPIVRATEKGKEGTAGPYEISIYRWMARTIAVSGSSDSCSGYVTLIIDDVNPFATAFGGGGIVLGILGLLGLLGAARGQGGAGGRFYGLIAGALAGLGFGLTLQQVGTLDPRSLVGLILPAGGALLGLIVAGMLRRA